MKKYLVCKRRNVAAAYARFFGPDAGALAEPWHSRTWAGLLHALRRPRRLRVEGAAEPAQSTSSS